MSDATRLIESKAIHYFGSLASEYGYLFRIINTHDKGIDGELEITQQQYEAVDKLPSPYLYVQIKGRSKPAINRNGETLITIDQSTLDYWKHSKRPVVILCGSLKVFRERQM